MQSVTAECPACGHRWKRDKIRYRGLIVHDLRRTGARNLRRAGVPETVIQVIGGWRSRSVFQRYAIVDQSDIAAAMDKLQASEREAEERLQVQLG